MKPCVNTWLTLATAYALISGCATPPADAPVAPAPAPAQASAPAAALEARHQVRAHAYARERNWADALVQWELLVLLNPGAQEYRDAVADTRKRISDTTASLMRPAEQARQQGNFDQATLLYLSILNVDRDNAVAAQALRAIDAERTRRSYLNRPPRGNMQ